MNRPLPRILTLTTLYPNPEQINHGIFVETRLRFLLASGQLSACVMAPVPWFPSTAACFGHYASFARVPATEQRQGISITHPRYALLPKIGMLVAPLLMALSLRATIARLIRSGEDFDLIDAHYFYPDGVAAMLLGKYFNKPVVITARGSDINLIAQRGLAKKMVVWAAKAASAVITVSQALKDEMIKLGVPSSQITPLRNGVDLTRFYPADRIAIRKTLELTRHTLLSVGSLTRHKGHELVIEALGLLPNVDLMIAGSGPEDARLRDLAVRLGVADRVRFVGPIPQPELFRYYNAADVMVLASSREGWANVLLEAMACGTPVIASDVGGSTEVVTSLDAGLMLPERTATAIAKAVQSLQNHGPTRSATRRYAERFSWDATTEGQLNLFKTILRGDS